MTPMGISWGATMVRANRSPTTMKEAPKSMPTGSTLPVIGAHEEADDVGHDETDESDHAAHGYGNADHERGDKKRFRRMACTSTPRDAAASAPMARALSDRAWAMR